MKYDNNHMVECHACTCLFWEGDREVCVCVYLCIFVYIHTYYISNIILEIQYVCI